jgi:hypothetical protein
MCPPTEIILELVPLLSRVESFLTHVLEQDESFMHLFDN